MGSWNSGYYLRLLVLVYADRLGSQIMLVNPFGTLAFSAVLYYFFSNRIRGEAERCMTHRTVLTVFSL